jgi:hypothetical protein
VRVGEDTIGLSNVGAGETVKFETTIMASGVPASVSIQEISQAAKTISFTVNSTPQGAMLKLDGSEVGVTPRMIYVGVGKHTLTFSKEGFTTGNFPLEISRDDVSGGTVSYELGASAFDSIELRDGSVLSGDLVSIQQVEHQQDHQNGANPDASASSVAPPSVAVVSSAAAEDQYQNNNQNDQSHAHLLFPASGVFHSATKGAEQSGTLSATKAPTDGDIEFE